MDKYNVENLHEGMIVGESVFDENNKLLIAAGFRLENKHIDAFKKKGITTVFINKEGTENIEAKSIISEQVKKELSATVYSSTKEIHKIISKAKENREDIKRIIKKDKYHINTIIKNSGISRVINKIIEDILDEPWVVINLDKMKEQNSELYAHVLNVTIISLCIGYKLRFSMQELKELGLSVINYDIGMLAIPEEILNKEAELTEQEKNILMQHTVYGHMMLSDIPGIPSAGSIVALCHHEYQDGTGYPQGLKGENRPPLMDMHKKGLIDRYAEIAAIADTYDMLTTGRRHFSKTMKPEKAIQKMIEMRKSKLNLEIIKTLISILPIYPIGTRIRVVNTPRKELMGCYGVIAQFRPKQIFQPIVVLIESKQKQRLPKVLMLDFAKHKGFKIEMVD